MSGNKAVTPSSSQFLSKVIDGGTKPYTCKEYGKFLVAGRWTDIFVASVAACKLPDSISPIKFSGSPGCTWVESFLCFYPRCPIWDE